MQMVAPRKKKIGGKVYDFHEGFRFKADAERKAMGLRSGAYSVRVVRIPKIQGYFLYSRVKPLHDKRSR